MQSLKTAYTGFGAFLTDEGMERASNHSLPTSRGIKCCRFYNISEQIGWYWGVMLYFLQQFRPDMTVLGPFSSNILHFVQHLIDRLPKSGKMLHLVQHADIIDKEDHSLFRPL
ncbi:hypothetical protein [Paenibacillus sp. MBLB4367]|uniref:hypothetical protein n=1 Tax=Paenibacillus sp. MBLB4367 TaxID=3384767 RepID=UPI00390834FB